MTSRETTPLLSLGDERPLKKSVTDRLYVLAFGAIGWPWLAKSLYGGSKRKKAELIRRLGVAEDALPNLGSWKADVGFLRLIADHIEELKPETVVELGAGATSLIAAKALQKNGKGRVVTFEQHGQFAGATAQWLRDNGLDSDIRHAPLKPAPGGWPGYWYDLTSVPDKIDLLIIDGPPWTIHPFARGAAETLFDRIPVGGALLLDDAARPGERIVARRWRRNWANLDFRLSHAGSKGTLIGKRLR